MKFFRYWENSGCQTWLFYEVYYNLESRNIVPGGSMSSTPLDPVLQVVPSMVMNAIYRVDFRGSWIDHSLDIERIQGTSYGKRNGMRLIKVST